LAIWRYLEEAYPTPDFFAAGKTAATSPKNDGQAYFAGNQR
jgi:glutathione S-transferase